MFRWNVRMTSGKTLHVEFVDQGLVPGSPRPLIALPIEERIDHHLDAGTTDGLPIDQVLEPVEIDRLGIVLGDQIVPRQDRVVVVLLEAV